MRQVTRVARRRGTPRSRLAPVVLTVLVAGVALTPRASTRRIAVPVEPGSSVDPPAEAGVIPPRPVTLRDFAAGSDLAFRGSVESVEFVLSEAASRDENVRVPFTLVTYRVHDVLHGMGPGPRLTLRFIGGLDPRSGLTLGSSMTPQFAVGDEDILFVRDNTTSLCPLVGELAGRVRVARGRVFSDDGHVLQLDAGGALRATAKRLGDNDAQAEGLYADELAERVRAAASGLRPRSRFVSARRSDVVFAPDMTPAPPPIDGLARTTRDLEAERERERLLQDREGSTEGRDQR